RNHALYARSIGEKNQLAAEIRLTASGKRELSPTATTRDNGEIALASQRFEPLGVPPPRPPKAPPEGQLPADWLLRGIRIRTCVSGKWAAEIRLPRDSYIGDIDHGGDAFEWTLATGPGGRMALLHDYSYEGDYDVDIGLISTEDRLSLGARLANSSRFE